MDCSLETGTRTPCRKALHAYKEKITPNKVINNSLTKLRKMLYVGNKVRDPLEEKF